MLFEAERSEAFPERKEIYSSTKAIFFLGTPHRGSNWAQWGEIATNLAGVVFDTNSASIKHLKVNGGDLMQLQKNFELLLYRRTFWVYTFIEAKGFKPLPFLKSKVSLTPIVIRSLHGLLIAGQIVKQEYATVGDPGRERVETINANHVDMCRFWGKGDPGYKKVAGELIAFITRSTTQVDCK
jgi:hypothetical protein